MTKSFLTFINTILLKGCGSFKRPDKIISNLLRSNFSSIMKVSTLYKVIKVLGILGVIFLIKSWYYVTLSDQFVYYTEFFNNDHSLHRIEMPEPDRTVLLASKCACQQHQKYLLNKSNRMVTVHQLLNSSGGQPTSQKLYVFKEEEFQQMRFTCSLYNVLRRGRDQKVVSFSLYGSDSYYWDYTERIVEQIHKLYPGWVVRIYVDKAVDSDFKCHLVCLTDKTSNLYMDNVDVCEAESLPLAGKSIYSSEENVLLNVN